MELVREVGLDDVADSTCTNARLGSSRVIAACERADERRLSLVKYGSLVLEL